MSEPIPTEEVPWLELWFAYLTYITACEREYNRQGGYRGQSIPSFSPALTDFIHKYGQEIYDAYAKYELAGNRFSVPYFAERGASGPPRHSESDYYHPLNRNPLV